MIKKTMKSRNRSNESALNASKRSTNTYKPFKATTTTSNASYASISKAAYNIVIHDDCKYYVLTKNDSNLLVFGYIRILLIKYNINIQIVPVPLINIFFKFYYEIMPLFLTTKHISINYERYEIFCDHNINDKVYCVSQMGWNHGVHEFKIKCIELGNKSHAIGVVTNRDGFINCNDHYFNNDWSFDSAISGTSYQLYFCNENHDYWKDGIYAHDEGWELFVQKISMKWNLNDIISFKINCNEWKLTFYINNKKVGDTLDLIKNKKYYAAIGIGGDMPVRLQFVE